ncbi:MAG: GNAT family N-acetyltransferase [Chloroflexi bacterium]|nr:GNAT family N-acetyltransferase [Chloroflexota bacterium]
MLTGKRIILRTVREADLPKLYELRAVIQNMGEYWPLHMISEFLDKKRFNESGWWAEDHGSLLITDHQGDILGQVNYFKASPVLNAFEIGYRIYQPENWGKGFTSEAVALFVPFLFETKQVDRIQAMISHNNVGSRRVLEKCGFTFEGILRKALFHHGQYQDLALYSILRSECPPLHTQMQFAKEAK